MTYDDVADIKAALASIAALLEQILTVQERQLKELQRQRESQ